MSETLKGKTVAILATNGFEQVELTEPKEALEEAGATTCVIAPDGPSIKSWDETDWGTTVQVDRTLDDADAADYDALLLPGGVLNPDQLRMNEDAISFVKAFFASNKPVAAICHGPQLLIEAGVVDGRSLTSYSSIQTDLVNAGAEWRDEELVQDGNLTTSRNPGDLPVFNKAIVDAFAKSTAGALQ